MAQQWTLADMPPQAGKVALVTGANRGLGLEIAAGLAGAGATVVMACRDTQRAQAAAAEVRQRIPQAQLDLMPLDLADLSSVRRFAQEFRARYACLDLLCNNASAIMVPLQKTRDGFEMHIGTNHLGPFALTGLLLDRLQAAPAARLVNTSSMAHRLTKGVNLDDLHFERRPYKEMDAYGQSKLAVLLFTFEIERRLRQSGAAAIAVAAHPGWANTNPDQGGLMMRLTGALMAQPPAMGALPALYAATAPGVRGGDHFGPGGFKELRGYPVKVGCSETARDPELARRLWTQSETLTGVRCLS